MTAVAAPSGRVVPSLRAIEPADAEAACRMANLPGFRRGTLRMPFESVELWRKAIADVRPEHTWLVADVDGVVVGQGSLFRRTRPRIAHLGDVALGVHDGFTGRGIGTAILTALLDLADNWHGLKRLELEVYADNDTAHRLYLRHGFEVEGRRVKAALTDGRYVDTVTMARLRF